MLTIYFLVLYQPFTKTREKRTEEKRQLSPLNETLNDFIVGKGTNVSAMENETLEQQTNGQHNNVERFVDSAIQNQVIENYFNHRIRRAVNNALLTVENRMHNTILTAMDKMVIPRVEMAVKSITGSSGHGPKSEVQNPDRKDFLGNAGNTPLMSASIWLDLNTNQDGNHETLNEENYEDGDFPALRPNYDRWSQAHHNTSVGTFQKSKKKVEIETELVQFTHTNEKV